MIDTANPGWKQGLGQATNAMRAVYVRELAAYFLTPLAYVFIAIFLIALGAFTFEIGRFPGMQPCPPKMPPCQLIEDSGGIRVVCQSLGENRKRQFRVTAGAALHMPASTLHQLPSGGCFPRNLKCAGLFGAVNLRAKQRHNFAAYGVLNAECIGRVMVIAL